MEQTMTAYNAGGTLVVPEKRSVIKKFKDWYQRRGMAERSDKLIVFVRDAKKGSDKVVAAVAPTILEIFGDEKGKAFAKFVPALCKVSGTVADITTKGILKAKGAVENFLGIERSENSPEISPDMSTFSADIKEGLGGIINMTKKTDGVVDKETISSEQLENVETELSENIGMKR